MGARVRSSASQATIYVGLAGFRSALRRFLAFSEVALRTAGVTSQQYQAMLAIAASPKGSLTMKALAEEMLLRPNGAVQLVDRLEAIGLVDRVQSNIDRRNVALTLSPRGVGMIKVLASEHRRELLKHSALLLESLRRLNEMQESETSSATV